MFQIDVPEKITNDTEFEEELSAWIASASPEHVYTCLHEATHMVYKRDCGFEPELYGPDDEPVFYHGIGWRTKLGATEGLPQEISLSADVLLVAKSHLGPAYILEKLRGDEWKKEIWEQARGDLALYNKWYVLRHHNVGDMLDAEGHHVLSSAKIRDSVYEDFAQFAFRQRLMAAAREYEATVKQK
jgi:hypothetical protein